MSNGERQVLCEVCGDVFWVKSRRGPTAKFCSNGCRQKAYRARKNTTIPKALRDARRWVRCDGKIPCGLDGGPLKWSDDSQWVSFHEVRKAEGGDGFGFVLGGGFACIDLDDCVTEDGELSLVAQNILAANPDCWVERSQSMRGLHIFGLLPEGPGRRMPGFEVYSVARFIRVTGHVFRRGDLRMLNVQL